MNITLGFSGNYVRKTESNPWLQVWTKNRWFEASTMPIFLRMTTQQKGKRWKPLLGTGEIQWDQMITGLVSEFSDLFSSDLEIIFKPSAIVFLWFFYYYSKILHRWGYESSKCNRYVLLHRLLPRRPFQRCWFQWFIPWRTRNCYANCSLVFLCNVRHCFVRFFVNFY